MIACLNSGKNLTKFKVKEKTFKFEINQEKQINDPFLIDGQKIEQK